jgi:O-antigen/teichoic acid export membrane protein
VSGDPTGSTPQPGDRPATPPGDRAAAGPDGGQAAGEHLRGVARGGALNLLGAVIWGASNFVLLAILTRGMGADSAGVVIIGIAVFNILATLTGMGCSSGLVRMTSQYRATRQADLLRPTLLVAVVPVAVAGVLAAVFMVVAGSWLADVFGGGQSTEEVQDTLRAMAPFLPFAAVYWVLIQGSRGYDTMRPVVVVDKIGRGLVLPAVAWIGVAAGLGPAGIGAAWAATNLVALFPSVWVTARLVRRTEARQGVEGRSQEPVRSVASTF